MATISTGEVSKHLGFLVTRAYIESLDIEPAELVKGHPRWNKSDLPNLCHRIAAKMKALAVKADDDDEL